MLKFKNIYTILIKQIMLTMKMMMLIMMTMITIKIIIIIITIIETIIIFYHFYSILLELQLRIERKSEVILILAAILEPFAALK